MKRVELFRRSEAIGCSFVVLMFASLCIALGFSAHSWLAGLVSFVVCAGCLSPLWWAIVQQVGKALLIDAREIRMLDHGQEAWRLAWEDLERIEHGQVRGMVTLVGKDGRSYLIPGAGLNSETYTALQLRRPHGSDLEQPRPSKPWPRWLSSIIAAVGGVVVFFGTNEFVRFETLVRRFNETSDYATSQQISAAPLGWIALKVFVGVMALLVGGASLIRTFVPKRPAKTRHDVFDEPLSLAGHLAAGDLSPWIADKPRFSCGAKGRKYNRLQIAVAYVGIVWWGGLFLTITVWALASRFGLLGAVAFIGAIDVFYFGFAIFSVWWLVLLLRTKRVAGWVVESDGSRFVAISEDGTRHHLVRRKLLSNLYLGGEDKSGDRYRPGYVPARPTDGARSPPEIGDGRTNATGHGR